MRVHVLGILLFALFSAAQLAPSHETCSSQDVSSVDSLWSDLGNADAGKAYRAIWALARSPAEAISHFAQHLKPTAAPDRARVENLLEKLNSDNFTVREKANRELINLDSLVESPLREVLKANPSLETRQRVEKLLSRLAGPVTLPDQLRAMRAVEVLEYIGTEGAQALLSQYSGGAPAARLTEHARKALDRLAKLPTPAVPAKAAATDLYGDPLPQGAAGRLGTIRFRRDFQGVSGLAFLPDGKSLLTAGGDHQVQVWDIATGHLTHKLRTGPASPGSIALSGFALAPDAKHLAVAVAFTSLGGQPGPREIRVYAFPSGELVRTFPRGDRAHNCAMAFSSDGKLLLSFSSYEAVLRVEDFASGKELAQRKFPSDVGAGLAMSSDGQYVALASGVNSRKAFLWKWRDEDLRELPLKSYGIEHISFSPDGKLLAAVDDLYRLLVWQIPTGRLVHTQESIDSEFHYWRKPIFSPDGKTLVVIMHRNRGGHGKVHLLDPATGESKGYLQGVGESLVAISADSRTLAVTHGTGVRFFDLSSRQELRDPVESHVSAPSLLVASPEGHLVTGGDDGTVRIWNGETMKVNGKWTVDSWVRGIALSPDQRLLAGSSLDDAVHVWEMAGGQELYRLAGHGRAGGRRTLGFLPDGQGLISYGDDHYLRWWDVKTGKARHEHAIRPDGMKIPDDGDAGGRLEFELFFSASLVTPDGKTLVLDRAANVYLFDMRTGKQLTKFASEGRSQRSLAASPDSKYLLISAQGDYRSGKHVLSLTELATGRPVQRSLLPGSSSGPVAFSPDGRMYAASVRGTEAEILIYETASGNVRATIRGFPGQVRALAFFPGSRRLASSLTDATVVLWDLASLPPSEKGP